MSPPARESSRPPLPHQWEIKVRASPNFDLRKKHSVSPETDSKCNGVGFQYAQDWPQVLQTSLKVRRTTEVPEVQLKRHLQLRFTGNKTMRKKTSWHFKAGLARDFKCRHNGPLAEAHIALAGCRYETDRGGRVLCCGFVRVVVQCVVLGCQVRLWGDLRLVPDVGV